MEVSIVIVAASALAVMLICAFLALSSGYHSGMFGTLFLGLIALGAFARLESIFDVQDFVLSMVQHRASPSSVLVWFGAAGWFGRAAVCYLRRLPGGSGWYACMLPQKHRAEDVDVDEAVAQ